MLSSPTSNPHDQTLLVDDPHDHNLLVDDPHDQTLLVDDPHDHNLLVDDPHDQTLLVDDPHDPTPLVDDTHDQTPLVDDTHDQTPLVDDTHDQTPLVDDPQDQTLLVDDPQDQTLLVDDPHDPTLLVDDPHDQSLPIDKSDDQKLTMNNQKQHASSSGNSQDQHSSVSESPDHSSVSDSQNTAPSVDDTDILHTYKTGILQLRALRLQLGKVSYRSRSQGNHSYHRRQRRSIASEELKSPVANIPRGNSLEEIPHLVKNQSRLFEQVEMYSTSDSYIPSLNQDRQYPFLARSRHTFDTSKRLNEEDPRKQVETLFPKDLRGNASKSSTHPHATVQFNKRGCSDGRLAARKDKKQKTDKKYCYETFLDTSGRICEGRDCDMVKMLPRLRLSGLPHLVGDRSYKTVRNSVILNESNRILQTDGDKWGSGYANLSSKWANWKRWIGNTLSVRQTRADNPGDNCLIKGDYRRITGGFTTGDPHFLQGRGKLSGSGTDADHGTEADSRWHRPRRDPPASPADLEDFLSPVTRVIITTTERHW